MVGMLSTREHIPNFPHLRCAKVDPKAITIKNPISIPILLSMNHLDNGGNKKIKK